MPAEPALPAPAADALLALPVLPPNRVEMEIVKLQNFCLFLLERVQHLEAARK